jgi:hypothetical protein
VYGTIRRTSFSFDRHNSEFLGYQNQSSDEHSEHLELYLAIIGSDTKDAVASSTNHTIPVSDDFKIGILVDWKDYSVLPLFLQASVSKYRQIHRSPWSW